ncbi:unnamed protein product [Fraxinus pennsylvanica]|uniref:Uncharacterized protein n=1 Tax=Fraxinus pennsylvanica TaxID=56036 RepID=A0AAD2DLS3_9LAMI|nr:unnamed protein product [Fraxinus pennsylvanica]
MKSFEKEIRSSLEVEEVVDLVASLNPSLGTCWKLLIMSLGFPSSFFDLRFGSIGGAISFDSPGLMRSSSKSRNCHFDLEIEAESQENKGRVAFRNCSNLLELAATDDLDGFICEAEERGCDIDVKVFT